MFGRPEPSIEDARDRKRHKLVLRRIEGEIGADFQFDEDLAHRITGILEENCTQLFPENFDFIKLIAKTAKPGKHITGNPEMLKIADLNAITEAWDLYHVENPMTTSKVSKYVSEFNEAHQTSGIKDTVAEKEKAFAYRRKQYLLSAYRSKARVRHQQEHEQRGLGRRHERAQSSDVNARAQDQSSQDEVGFMAGNSPAAVAALGGRSVARHPKPKGKNLQKPRSARHKAAKSRADIEVISLFTSDEEEL